MIRRLIKRWFKLEDVDKVYKEGFKPVENNQEALYVLNSLIPVLKNLKTKYDFQLNNVVLSTKMELGKLVGARGSIYNVITLIEKSKEEYKTKNEDDE